MTLISLPVLTRLTPPVLTAARYGQREVIRREHQVACDLQIVNGLEHAERNEINLFAPFIEA